MLIAYTLWLVFVTSAVKGVYYYKDCERYDFEPKACSDSLIFKPASRE